MQPDKKKTVNGHKVEQFYWAGKNVVYIDNRLTSKKYNEITSDNIEIKAD